MTDTTTKAPVTPQLTRIYLRASTDKQDELRAKETLTAFAKEKGLIVAGYYSENESGTLLERPEINRLIADSSPNDIFLCEGIDRMSRLNFKGWQDLKQRFTEKQINIVAYNLAPTHSVIALSADENTRWFATIINNLVIDLSAQNARIDYETRRMRTRQGIDKILANPAEKSEKYKGRKVDIKKYVDILDLLEKGVSHRKIAKVLNTSHETIGKARQWDIDGRPQIDWSNAPDIGNKVADVTVKPVTVKKSKPEPVPDDNLTLDLPEPEPVTDITPKADIGNIAPHALKTISEPDIIPEPVTKTKPSRKSPKTSKPKTATQNHSKGKQPNMALWGEIIKLLEQGKGYADIVAELGTSSATIAKAKKWKKEQTA